MEAIAAALCRDGIAVRDRFLDDLQLRGLAECSGARFDRGEFRAARIGAGAAAQRQDAIRGDFICWLTPPHAAVEHDLLASLETLRLAINAHSMLGLFDLEAHYARYPAGAGYARHVDQPRGRAERLVSMVIYLNAHWNARWGGELRFFAENGAQRDVVPVGGRLVCFLSAGLEHAVLPARRLRSSITGWFRSRP